MNALDFLQAIQVIKNSHLPDDEKTAKFLTLIVETDLNKIIKQLKG